jgi:two-component system phosphate regulon sensor histidine kinase PhoR
LTWWVILSAAAVVLALVGWRYAAAWGRLREGLRRVARGDRKLPLLLDLPVGLRSAAQDFQLVAERVGELERTASEERTETEAILGSISEGVFVVDRQMRVRVANPGVEAMFTLSSPPVGQTVMEVFRRHEMHRLVQDCLQSLQPQRGEILFDSVGEPRVFELSVSPLTRGENQGGAIGVVHDITQIKGLEKVRRDFVANVSHELRTPMTIISGYLETLLDGGLDDRAMTENALGVMHKHADRLRHLVDDLLVISRAESHSVPLELVPVDLRELLSRVVHQFEGPIRERAATVSIHVPDAQPELRADALMLEHAFVNLLDNALKHGHGPGLAVDFFAEHSGGEVRIRVRDNGPGIPFADQEHIFERFYRVHKDRSRDTGGTGLGLAIVKHIVQAHGGNVSVESAPGRGSAFLVTLPVNPPAAAA